MCPIRTVLRDAVAQHSFVAVPCLAARCPDRALTWFAEPFSGVLRCCKIASITGIGLATTSTGITQSWKG